MEKQIVRPDQKRITFVGVYLFVIFMLGIVLPAYLSHTKSAFFQEWKDVILLIFPIGFASMIDTAFLGHKPTWVRGLWFIIATAVGLLLTIGLVYLAKSLFSFFG